MVENDDDDVEYLIVYLMKCVCGGDDWVCVCCCVCVCDGVDCCGGDVRGVYVRG